MITREYNIQAEGSLPYAKLKKLCIMSKKHEKNIFIKEKETRLQLKYCKINLNCYNRQECNGRFIQ